MGRVHRARGHRVDDEFLIAEFSSCGVDTVEVGACASHGSMHITLRGSPHHFVPPLEPNHMVHMQCELILATRIGAHVTRIREDPMPLS